MVPQTPKIPAHDFHIFHAQDETLDRLKSGEISDLRVDVKWPADAILSYELKEGFLQQVFMSFPDPRKTWSVPMNAILSSQILRSLNDEHSFLLAPYMLSSADLITQLGYNIKTLNEGFNDQNIHPRKSAFHGETHKHILLKTKAQSLVDWFNEKWQPIWKAQAPGRTYQYILDGMKIPIPENLKNKFQGCGVVRDEHDNLVYGYKAVFLYEIVDRKGVIVAMKIAPIQVHDVVLGRELVKNFNFEKEAMLIMDRSFLDGAWITELKSQRQIDVCIPLQYNMELTQAAIAQADHRQGWQSHPTRAQQQAYEITRSDLYWKECEYFQSGVLVRWVQKNGVPNEVLFVTTKYGVKAKRLLEIYDQRAAIEVRKY
jgi:hypothetical protein